MKKMKFCEYEPWFLEIFLNSGETPRKVDFHFSIVFSLNGRGSTGATTLSIMALFILTLSITMLSMMTLSMMTLSIMILNDT